MGQADTSMTNAEDSCGFNAYGFSSSTACLPFLWQAGVMKKLVTLGGNNGFAHQINNRGEVAGIDRDFQDGPNPGLSSAPVCARRWTKRYDPRTPSIPW